MQYHTATLISFTIPKLVHVKSHLEHRSVTYLPVLESRNRRYLRGVFLDRYLLFLA